VLHPSIEMRSKGTIHGYGLFATQLIPEGALIWELNEPTYTLKEIETWPEDRYRDFKWYGFQCGVDRYSSPKGASREMNHSCDPNTWGKDSDKLYARRDIQVDEEVTYDYSSGDIDLEFNLECHCGSSNCRGTISNRDHLNPAWQEQYGENLPDYVLAAIKSSKE
jgi:uncharacterized protein